MNLAQPFLQFLLGYALASLIGTPVYFGMRALKNRNEGCALILGFVPMTVLTGLLLLFARVYYENEPTSTAIAFGILVASVTCSLAGAVAEKVLDQHRESLFFYSVFISSTSLVSLLSGCLASAIYISNFLMSPPSFVGYALGLWTLPSAVPTFIWLWRSSQTRAGIDRPFNSFDETNPPH